MTEHVETFRVNLEEFASKHKNEIKKNAHFRHQFTEICVSIGVDPLASGKGFWLILDIGNFYYELAVQIVEVCMVNYKNGGLISLDELKTRLVQARKRRKEHQEITNEDLLAAAKKLKIFGNGFSVVPIGRGKYLLQSVPGELSMDHIAVLRSVYLQMLISILCKELKWEENRAQKSLDYMMKEELAWLHEQNKEEILYWFPSLFAAYIVSNK